MKLQFAAIVKEAPRGTHLTAPEVYAKARGNGLPVSISTVYRTLTAAQRSGRSKHSIRESQA